MIYLVTTKPVRKGEELFASYGHGYWTQSAVYEAGDNAAAVSELAANAARYSPANTTIRICWQKDAGGALLSVADNGPGIAAEHIPRLTERFYRVDSGRKATDGGTGLGLAIVKHSLEHHESELIINSEPGTGSTFSARFPHSRLVVVDAA